MIKVAICDDVLTDAGLVEKCLLKGPLDVECEVFYSSTELLDVLDKTGQKFDMYILDIEMEGMTGIELAEKIRESDINCLIVFLTGYPEHMQEVFGAVVFDYIVKPINQERANALLTKAKRYLIRANSVFQYTFNKRSFSIRTNEICYFQREKRKMVFYLIDGTERYSYMRMDDVLKQLNETEFARVSYSAIVNLRYVANMKGQNITLENGITLVCNKAQLETVKQKHLHYVNRS